MTRDDIRRIMNVTKHPSICISIDLLADVPGYVRSVYLRPPSTIVVEYEFYGLDEGGDYFYGQYSTLDAAIDAAAQFTGKALEEWTDLEQEGYYPEREQVNVEEGHERMGELLNSKSVPVPRGAEFVRRG